MFILKQQVFLRQHKFMPKKLWHKPLQLPNKWKSITSTCKEVLLVTKKLQLMIIQDVLFIHIQAHSIHLNAVLDLKLIGEHVQVVKLSMSLPLMMPIDALNFAIKTENALYIITYMKLTDGIALWDLVSSLLTLQINANLDAAKGIEILLLMPKQKVIFWMWDDGNHHLHV